MRKCIQELISSGKTETPIFSHKQNIRLKNKTIKLECKDILIIDGILSLHDEKISDSCDLKIFIDC